jgi:peptidoglycan/xylan/chitin deacetylase (PgdA/CDA1 family)
VTKAPRLPRRALLWAAASAGALLGLPACGPSVAASPATPAGGSVDPAGSDGSAGPASGGASIPGSEPPPARSGAGPNGAGPGDVGPSRAGRSGGGPSGVGGAATELVRANTDRPEVALTFHGSGDRTLDRTVLQALARGDTRVTVLAVGTWLAQYPDAAKMVTDLGHELGNHTWSHKTMSRLTVSEQRLEIVRCRDRLAELTGSPGAFFRPSAAQHATAEQLALAGAAGYPRVLSYDVDSLDWTDPGPLAIRAQLRKATAGSVVSLHLGHQGTLAAIPGILADLKDRGLRPVTASQLFAG